MIELEGSGWTLKIFTGEQPIDIANDNLDIEVRLADGTRHGATFFTLANIASLMKKYRETGEGGSGMYFWCSDLVVVRDLAPATIKTCVEEMIEAGELTQAFHHLEEVPGVTDL